MVEEPIVIVSNRGPLSFALGPDGEVVAKRGSGGLVSGLAPLAGHHDTVWISAAISDGDRAAVRAGVVEAEGYRVHILDLDPDDYRAAYDTISNETLWFAHHRLFDLSRSPSFDDAWWEAWDAYVRVNRAFADAIIEIAPDGARVLVQDYHLALVGWMVRGARPSLSTVHFHHTPFAPPDDLAVLPPAPREAMLAGLGGFDACGFHSERWAANYRGCRLAAGLDAGRTFVAPLATDPDDIAAAAASPACGAAYERLASVVGDRLVITRVDRIELSKNIMRGFEAFDALLERRPEWRERVVFVACCYPSREGVAAYATYRADTEALVARINERWSTPGWTPIDWSTDDDYPRSVAALRRADVVVINPVRDGLNLVASEATLINERAAAVVLSTEAGVFDSLGGWCDAVHPYDVSATADALHRALGRPAAEREAQAAGRRAVALARTPSDWLADQLAAGHR